MDVDTTEDVEQLTLLAEGWADEAVEQVASHMTQEQKDYWISVVWEVARKYEEFSTNAVLEWHAKRGIKDLTLAEPRALGDVMRRAQALGITRPTDRFEKDRTPGAHARPKRIWRSLLWRA